MLVCEYIHPWYVCSDRAADRPSLKSEERFGDLLLRFKGSVFEGPRASLAIGTDLRLPTGDAENYLGTVGDICEALYGALVVQPPACEWNCHRSARRLRLAVQREECAGRHAAGRQRHRAIGGGASVPVVGAPFATTKDYLPDVFSWAVGTEVAFGRRNTLVIDFLGNQIGWIRGAQTLASRNITDPAPTELLPGARPMQSGLGDAGRTSFGQYSGAFGYKARIVGNLVATFQALVRFDNNGLTARVVPLYGLGYGF